ncbi:Endonuclease/exonuclease/phosphatase [Fusarium oxysporum]|nr:Endonuclease/exonuclease/phosphatase [Fusarium oxysporum]
MTSTVPMKRPLSKGQKKRFKAKGRKERLTRLVDSPSDLSIVQINVKAAPDRIQSLKNWIHNCDKRVDILCLQDLPSNIRGIQFPDHILAFGPNNPELLETQGEEQAKTKKRNALKIKSPYQEKEMLHAVAYLIHKSIPIADWDVEFHDDVNFGLAATLLLRISDDQTIAIHNVHNQLKKVKIPDLLQKVTATGQDFLVGDFNLHHTVWGGDKVKIIEPQAVELANGLNQARMGLLTTRGFPTYSRGQCIAGEYNSTIDLTYASSAIVPFVRKWESPDVPGFDSDHRVIMTTLNLEIDRVPSTYYLWKLADPNKFRACVDGSLKPLGFPALTTPAMTDNYARKVVQAFNPAIERLVPLAPPPGSKRPKARPSLVTQRAENLLKLAAERERNSGISTESQQHYKVKRFAQSVIRKERSASFHRMLSQDIAKRRRLYFWARRGATWNKKALMPIRQLKADNVTHRTPDGMAGCFRQAM